MRSKEIIVAKKSLANEVNRYPCVLVHVVEVACVIAVHVASERPCILRSYE